MNQVAERSVVEGQPAANQAADNQAAIRSTIFTDKAPLPLGTYSQAIKVGQVTCVARLKDAEMLARVAQATEDGLRHLHLLAHGIAVLRRFLVRHQHPYLRRTVSDSREPQFQAG